MLKAFKSIRRTSCYATALLLPLWLAGCHSGILDPKGYIAAQQKELFLISVLLMLIVVLPVFALTAFIAIRYRASNKKAEYDPSFNHSNKLEAIWWTIPCVIIAILAVITWIYTHRLDPYKSLGKNEIGQYAKKKPVIIQVVALEWKWLFIYPQQNIASVNFVEFPVNRPVEFHITADAPMNSFQIPRLGGQIYAMNGMRTRLHLFATAKGIYRGQSVNISGNGFSDMHFKAKVSSEKAYKQWLKHIKQMPNKLMLDTTYQNLAKASVLKKPQYYGAVENQLFTKIIKTFLTPNMHAVNKSEMGVQL
jgi:cytochrome o ubiquinol oxidase subunit 2